jgi:hypothetical protein
MKVGIITVRDVISERGKDEGLALNDKTRPWLAKVSKKHSFVDDRNQEVSTCADFAVGYYIKYAFPQVKVTFINPDDICLAEFKKHDLVFVIVFDLLESFHTEPLKLYHKYRKVFQSATNMFPSYEYQRFINSKCLYLSHFKTVPALHVVPCFCLCKEVWNAKPDQIKAAAQMLAFARKQGWTYILLKPVLGQEAIGVQFVSIDSHPHKLVSMIEKYMAVYPEVVLQEYIHAIGDAREYRHYFIAGKYVHCVATSGREEPHAKLKSEGGDLKDPPTRARMLKMAKDTLKHVPQIVVGGVQLPPLLNRVDLYDCLSGRKKIAIGEVEFVPSLLDATVLMDQMIGDQMINITEMYLQNKR